MKNVIVYTVREDNKNAWKRSENIKNSKIYINFQIENSIRVGWKKEDICFVTNFDHQYMGINCINAGNDYFKNFLGSCMAKYLGVRLILDITDDSVYLRDHDCFQIESFDYDMILGDYDFVCCGKEKRISDQSSFFSKNMINHIDNFYKKYENKDPSIGFMFKFGRFVINKCSNLNIVDQKFFPYRFNMVGNWRKTLNILNEPPKVFHQKLNNDDVRKFLINYPEIKNLYDKYSDMLDIGE